MIPRSQHFGDRAPYPYWWSGIMRIFEEAAFEAFLVSAGRRAHYAGKQPNASVEQHQRAHLSAGQDIVAARHFLDAPRLEDALVEALEPSAQDDRAGASHELAHAGLAARRTARRHGEDGPTIANAVDGGGEHIDAQHHPCPAAGRGVVYGAVLVDREVADVDRIERPFAITERPARQ